MIRSYDLKCLMIIAGCLLVILGALSLMGCARTLKVAQETIARAEMICDRAPCIIDGLYETGDITLDKKEELQIKLNQYCRYVDILKAHIDMFRESDKEHLENTLFNMEELKQDLAKESPFLGKNL